MCCTGYEMARYKGTQASHLYEESMHTLCTISEQTLLAEASTILDRSLSSHTFRHLTTSILPHMIEYSYLVPCCYGNRRLGSNDASLTPCLPVMFTSCVLLLFIVDHV